MCVRGRRQFYVCVCVTGSCICEGVGGSCVCERVGGSCVWV